MEKIVKSTECDPKYPLPPLSPTDNGLTVITDYVEFEIEEGTSHNAIEINSTGQNNEDNEPELELETNDDDRDQDFEINNYLCNGEKLSDVSDSESEIDSNNNDMTEETKNIQEDILFDEEANLDFDKNHEENTTKELTSIQNLNESFAEILKDKARKRVFRRNYLRRHVKNCLHNKHNKSNQNWVAKSQTFTACHMDPLNVISKLNVKETVFDMMKGDDISFEAKKDLLIVHLGDSYLKKHRKERSAYTCSSRMRELSRLLITFRKLTNNDQIEFKTILHPKNFDAIVTSARSLSGYDHSKKTFRSPSLAMHLGTSLKIMSDELSHLILKEAKGFTAKNKTEAENWLRDVKNFKKLVESRDETFKIAQRCENSFKNNTADEKVYKTLVQCSLALLIIFNRKRIGDVQYLKLSDYKNDQRSNYRDFESALSPTEKVLATKYRRVLNSGKGSKAVVILIPEIIEKDIKLLLKHRSKFIEEDNDYVFAIPGSKVKWGEDIAIRNLAKKMKLNNPSAITSNKLRKQIATVMQILNLSQDDVKQFSTFMGHTQKTHEEFYELPVDVYQTAKVSKMLLMIENGVPIEHKGKHLSEIDIDMEFAEENDNLHSDLHNIDDRPFEESVPFEKSLNIGSEEKEVCEHSKEDINVQEENENFIMNTETESTKILEKNDIEPFAPAPKKIKKTRWTEEEVNLIKINFGSFINENKYPSVTEIKNFCSKNNISRDPVVVKFKIQHLIKTLSRNP
ncbi:hypothetical protein NQ317_003099 [Molorchus minor]|uniref:Tyr recombinase domain-containing protein n=1 Tax=Molorchus minor TaxID=1323400 RepID=A0ABQ9IWC1_9CUCU|nr:hypothetical protein NQ317_003099 [Molorchus minor]